MLTKRILNAVGTYNFSIFSFLILTSLLYCPSFASDHEMEAAEEALQGKRVRDPSDDPNPRLRFDGLSKIPKYASPIVDSAFKQALCIDGDHGPETVLSFLNTFVPDFKKDPVITVTSQPLPLPPLPERNKKQTFLDFHVVTQSGEHVGIEIQAKRHPRFDERALFYLIAMHYGQLKALKKAAKKKYSTEHLSPETARKVKYPPNDQYLERDWYYHINKTYAIQIVDYDSQKARGIDTVSSVDQKFVERVKSHPMMTDQYIKHFMMTDQYSGQHLDEIQMIQLELPRFKKPLFPPQDLLEDPLKLKAFYESFTEEQWWISVFRQSSRYDEPFMDALKHAEVTLPPAIQILFDRLEYDQWNATLCDLYTIEFKELEDFQDQINWEKADSLKEGIEKGKKEGIELGREEGKKEEKKQIALEMLKKEMPKTLIAELTGLSEEEILTLEKGGLEGDF